PAKAAQGRTKTRLIPDPVRGAVVTLIFTWRVVQRLSVPTIAWRLNRDLAAYPPPGDGPGWTETSVAAILRNPKYTGHMVYGRTCKLPASRKPGPSCPRSGSGQPSRGAGRPAPQAGRGDRRAGRPGQ